MLLTFLGRRWRCGAAGNSACQHGPGEHRAASGVRRPRRPAPPAGGSPARDVRGGTRSSRSSSLTAGASRRRAQGTRSSSRTRPSSTASGPSIRTRRSRHPARQSACRRARWGTPRSATDDRVGSHPLPRPDAGEQVDRGGVVLREPGSRRRLRARRERPSPRPRLLRRRPLAHRPPASFARVGATPGNEEDVHPRLHRRAGDVSPHSAIKDLPEIVAEGARSCPFPAGITRWTVISVGHAGKRRGRDHGAKRSQS